MRRVYQGIYVKEMVLFEGETLEYQIYERGSRGRVLTAEGRLTCDISWMGGKTAVLLLKPHGSSIKREK